MGRPQTKEQVEAYNAFVNMQLKIWVTIIIMAAFITSLVFLLCTPVLNWKIVYASLDGILAPTMYVLCKHFFPALSATLKERN